MVTIDSYLIIFYNHERVFILGPENNLTGYEFNGCNSNEFNNSEFYPSKIFYNTYTINHMTFYPTKVLCNKDMYIILKNKNLISMILSEDPESILLALDILNPNKKYELTEKY